MNHCYLQQVSTPDKNSLKKTESPGGEPRNYKQVWQNAIKQQIMLGRMERENKRMVEDREMLEEKRLKLDYTDLRQDNVGADTWDSLLSQASADLTLEQLREGVTIGVPQVRRGEVWQLLVSKHDNSMDQFLEKFPNMNSHYDTLKSQLTSHQHAILIDLGRTFPNHGYFSGALGPGQCGLFNLLKSYSNLDTEVGYCQGLPFCVGLLLMHADEETSFSLLKYLMFNVGLRKQFHHDMSGLQVILDSDWLTQYIT